ncbi:BTB/POZ domain-containing protein 6-like [Armigeres subalbatus]|uniref:BTB/POZ domain-containing protein 6-like n=1 Tax=Armigeres subalbatus TaxID=124917 RepID=UPI002ED42B57
MISLGATMDIQKSEPISDNSPPNGNPNVFGSSTATKSRLARDIDFTSPITSRLKQLVNNEYLSDVVFRVGKAGVLIHAHKIIITLGSEVFYAQINGHFAEAKANKDFAPVIVTDIEPDIFTEVLKHIYYENVNITASNMLDIYYASEKYLLDILSLKCQEAFYNKISEKNVLAIFEHNRKYKFDVVDRICLEMICDNPLKFFKQKGFLELSNEGLIMITDRPAINCLKGQLQEVIESWEGENGPSSIVLDSKEVLCEKLHFFSETSFSTNVDTSFRLTVESPANLYGMGVLVGAKSQIKTPAEVEIIVMVENKLLASKKVPILNNLRTYDIMFEKQTIDNCTVQVTIKKPLYLENVQLLHFTKFQLISTDIQNKCKITCCSDGYQQNCSTEYHYCSYGSSIVVNCVSYLMCQAMDDQISQ